MNKTRHRFTSALVVAMLSAALPFSTARAAPLVYTPIPLVNGWIAFGSQTRAPTAAIDSESIVHLRGAVKLPSGSSPVPFVLPAQFRPSAMVYVPLDIANGKRGRLVIFQNGTAVVEWHSVLKEGWLFSSLDGITYPKN